MDLSPISGTQDAALSQIEELDNLRQQAGDGFAPSKTAALADISADARRQLATSQAKVTSIDSAAHASAAGISFDGHTYRAAAELQKQDFSQINQTAFAALPTAAAKAESPTSAAITTRQGATDPAIITAMMKAFQTMDAQDTTALFSNSSDASSSLADLQQTLSPDSTTNATDSSQSSLDSLQQALSSDATNGTTGSSQTAVDGSQQPAQTGSAALLPGAASLTAGVYSLPKTLDPRQSAEDEAAVAAILQTFQSPQRG